MYGAQEPGRVLAHVAHERRGPLTNVDVDERHHGSSDGVVERLVRRDAQRVPPLIPAQDLFLHAREPVDDLGDLRLDVLPTEAVYETDRTAHVAGDQFQEALGGG